MSFTPRFRGMTLVEVVISSAIMVGLMFVISTAIQSNADAVRFDMAANDTDTAARKAIRSIAEELANSGADDAGDYVTPDRTDGTSGGTVDSITFQPRLAVTGDASDWGTAITYQLEDSLGENSATAADDDNDGLTNEQALVRIQGGAKTIIDHGVLAFTVERAAGSDIITITITVGRAYERSKNGVPITRTFRSSIKVRNRPDPLS